jgi:hypothetical protein
VNTVMPTMCALCRCPPEIRATTQAHASQEAERPRDLAVRVEDGRHRPFAVMRVRLPHHE